MLNLSKPALVALLVAMGTAAWQDKCESFTATLPNVAIKPTYYPEGALVNLTSPSSMLLSSDLPAFCRLELVITTNATSGNKALTEVWLPDAWNDRLLGFGDGGLSGGVVYSSLATDGIAQGYSSFSTNTGHHSDPATGTWALNNPQAQIDYGYRAFQLSYQAAKALTEQYYGYPVKKKYYLGCSNAGRMGLVEAQRYPEDFDGMIIGAPATLARLSAWTIHQARQVLPVNGTRWIPRPLWSVIHQEVLKQCDGLDGVMDGIIGDPRECNFRPEAIVCTPTSNTSTCLTLDQIDAVKNLYTDWHDTNGTYLFSRFEPGGELGYPATYVGGPDIFIGPEYFKNFIFSNPEWDYNTLTIEDLYRAIQSNPGQTDNLSFNYTSYFARGGKMLQYAGLADQVVTSGNSYVFYNAISSFTAANTNLDPYESHRFFPVPGMGHCGGGDGADAFGAEGQRSRGMPPLVPGAEHDILAAMVEWVENGVAPDHLVAARYTNNDVTQGLDFTRKLCPYPQKAVFQGGDQNSSDSFECM